MTPGEPILVAEDDEINQKVLSRPPALLGDTAEIVGDGHEALSRWRRGRFRLLLTDLHMPRLDGYGLTAAIRGAEAGGPRRPIVAPTANALKGGAQRRLDLGMDGYRTKPVRFANLQAMPGKWLRGTIVGTEGLALPAPAADVVDMRLLAARVGDGPQGVAGLLQDVRLIAAADALQMRSIGQLRDVRWLAEGAHGLK